MLLPADWLVLLLIETLRRHPNVAPRSEIPSGLGLEGLVRPAERGIDPLIPHALKVVSDLRLSVVETKPSSNAATASVANGSRWETPTSRGPTPTCHRSRPPGGYCRRSSFEYA